MKNMHKVSDEDFDKLFQEKLYAYEAAPTDAVWRGIAGQLNTVKREGTFPILRLAAASLAGIIGLGMWLAANKEPMRLSGSPTTSPVIQKTESPAALIKPEGRRVTKSEPVKLTVKDQIPPKEEKDIPLVIKAKPAASKANVVRVAVLNTDADSKTSVVKQPEAIEKSISADRSEASEAPVLARVEEMPQDEEAIVRDKKIKSVGSLVNFVVGKIDKRKSKIIEFEDGDEGTKVSGLNLGLLKFKAKE